MNNIIISKGIIVNESRQFVGSLVVTDGIISQIIEGANTPQLEGYEIVNAEGCYILPGIIDTHVHFREPGLTHKADIETESMAAAYGGVTSYFDMPNTVPQTTTAEALAEKQEIASKHSHINWSFFPGATNDNIDTLVALPHDEIPGIKLFMGSSTGNMLVDNLGALLKIFNAAAENGLPVMAHCEDTEIINKNMEQVKKQMGDDPDVVFHPLIRSEEACMESSCLAASLARQSGAHLHIAHISTQAELDALFPIDRNVTCEATVAHLMFSNRDYSTLGAQIKCNPAIKKPSDRDALRQGLTNGQVYTIGTDHAPHAWEEKQGGAARAMSGMPMVQFSLVSILSLVDEGVLTIEQLVQLMAHNPATLFGIRQRGFIREGYHADLVIVKNNSPWTVTKDVIKSKCGWSPMEGREFQWKVVSTICNGVFALRDGEAQPSCLGEKILFDHTATR